MCCSIKPMHNTIFITCKISKIFMMTLAVLVKCIHQEPQIQVLQQGVLVYPQVEGVLAQPHCRTYMILSRTAEHDSLSNGSVIKLPPPTASKLGCWRNKQMVRPLLAHSVIKTDEFERLAKSSYYFFSRTNETHYIITVNKIYKRKAEKS